MCIDVQTETIEQTAYRLWEEAGYPHGRSLDFWVHAENIHEQAHSTASLTVLPDDTEQSPNRITAEERVPAAV